MRVPQLKTSRNSYNMAHMASDSTTFQISPPTGLIWSNNSCAYNSVFTSHQENKDTLIDIYNVITAVQKLQFL